MSKIEGKGSSPFPSNVVGLESKLTRPDGYGEFDIDASVVVETTLEIRTSRETEPGPRQSD